MRTLIINKFLFPNGGSETYIFKLGEALEQHGHEVQYFGMEHEGRCVGNRVNAYTSDMDFHGGSKLSKLTYPIKTIYSKEARVQLRKVLDDFKPDVCHLNNFNYQLTPSIILEIVKWRKETGRDCKIIFTAHDYQLVCPNHMLNTIVASELSDIADKMEKVPADQFKDELKKLLAEIVKEHKRVIFNGDGYSDAWVEEAAKRGLPNYKTTADCVPHYADEKNVKLFEKFGIFSKAEIEARVEILLESYSKTINIEALTMIDMAKKKYIPACLAYSKELADAIAVKKSIDVCTCVEKDLVKKVTEETEKAYDAVQKLEEVTAVAAAKTCMQEMANAYRDTVLPVMDDLRKAVDALEVLMPSTMWPVPAYSEMIFNV